MTLPVIPIWASDANYTGGPDVGTTTKVQPAYVTQGMTPGVPVTAQEMNYELNLLSGQVAGAYNHLGVIAGSNWYDGVTAASMTASSAFWTPPVWNYGVGLWLQAPSDTVTATPLFMSPDGRAWFSYGSGNTVQQKPVGFASSVDGTMVLVMTGAGSTVTTHTTKLGVVDDLTAQGFMGINVTCGVLVRAFSPLRWEFVGGKQVGANFVGIRGSSNPGTGAWTDNHASLPPNWVTSANHVTQMYSAQNDTAPGKCDASIVIIGSNAPTIGVDVTRLLTWNNIAGMVDVTPAAFAGKNITGLAWSPNALLWVAMLTDGTSSYVFTSPDSSTWTLTRTITGNVCVAIAIVGDTWLSWGSFDGLNRFIISTDRGVTWSRAKHTENPGTWLTSSGSQFMRTWGANVSGDAMASFQVTQESTF